MAVSTNSNGKRPEVDIHGRRKQTEKMLQNIKNSKLQEQAKKELQFLR